MNWQDKLRALPPKITGALELLTGPTVREIRGRLFNPASSGLSSAAVTSNPGREFDDTAPTTAGSAKG